MLHILKIPLYYGQEKGGIYTFDMQMVKYKLFFTQTNRAVYQYKTRRQENGT